MINAVTKKIRLLKSIQPNSTWLQSQRDVLLLEISQSGKKSRFSRLSARFARLASRLAARRAGQVWNGLPGFLLPAFKPVLVFGVLLCMIFGGGYLTVLAAKNSLPGDLLYPIKITLENARVKISSKEAESKLQLEYVDNRVDELSQIVNQQNENLTIKTERVVRAVDKLKAQVASTKVNLNAETAGIIGEKTVQSEQALIEAKEKIVSEFNGEESKEIVQAIDAAVKEIKETSILATEFSEGKVGTEVQMEVKQTIEPEVEQFDK